MKPQLNTEQQKAYDSLKTENEKTAFLDQVTMITQIDNHIQSLEQKNFMLKQKCSMLEEKLYRIKTLTTPDAVKMMSNHSGGFYAIFDKIRKIV